ncbi:MAG TPA: PEP/pyruvate-binding domain-containing protein [Longimicrobiaceae bacterium]|nr:PEP/pyruvate-binding domain-containing protein [Longimicrobiaceae bacterium]
MADSVLGTRRVLAPDAALAAGPEAVGGKAYNLARLGATGVRVPRWIVVPVDAFEAVALAGRDSPRLPDDAEAVRSAVAATTLPADFVDEVVRALRDAGITGVPLAVRSSAASEDGAGASFAGQFDTVLGVPAGDRRAVADAIRAVWASAFNAHALAYGGGGVRMAVVLQELVEPDVSGVGFSADPVTGSRDTVVVSAVYGLGEGLVSGELDADTFHSAAREGGEDDVRAVLAHKDRAVRPSAAGTEIVPVEPELRDARTLSDGEVRRISATLRELERALGAPQDVEWALAPAEGRPRELFVLQARPITTLGSPSPSRPAAPAEAPRTGERRIWDNSNIVESYAGVTTPLTFSFARSVYEDVYRQFCAVVGVENALVERNRHVFANMLGLVRGRVYYNLLNWYRVLALLPGFSLNRAFMERMMGVREKLESPPEAPRAASRGRDALRVARMLRKLTAANRGLTREVPAFHARVDAALAPLARADLSTWDADELLALYRRLEEDLLRHWQTPLVNDFFAMIWFGVLGRLVEKWLPDAPPTLVNDLLAGEGGIISVEPARRVMALARDVSAEPALRAAFDRVPDDGALWREIATADELRPLRDAMAAYLEKFGDRCTNELKLETVTLGENPEFLVQMVRTYVRSGMTDPDATREREQEIRRAAEARVRASLRGPRRSVFFGVLRRTRERVRDRENLRFERTRVFGVVRRIFVGIGTRMADAGLLREARDVFWLRTEEVFGTLDGTATVGDLRAVVEQRKAEFAAYEREPSPPERFETFGPPALSFAALAPDAPSTDVDAPTLKGTGCCPGVVRARVRVVTDPREAGVLDGHVLVAERTDPGWTLLFPPAAGLLVQRGSLLSHSAIVAREMGLPCIVGIPGLMQTLRDGEIVEMDGTTGVVLRLEQAGEDRGG